MSYTLYGFAMSSCTQRIRSILNYKKIPYTQVSVNFLKKEQLTEEYKKIHPRQIIPALVTPEGHTLIESLTIAEYLEETHPEKPILPKNKIQRAQVRAIAEYINSSIQPFQHLGIQQYINSHSEKQLEWKDQWTHWNMLGISNLEKSISRTRGRFSVGDQLTLADIMIYCQIDSAQTRFGLDFGQYHNIMNIYFNVNNIKEIEQSRGIYQHDFPK
ncbi:unnamed protein product [Paramecium primaurelia]|uniref:Maleylacetoacetate isomerase n=1 Tax=Paramecium primaurelia TaxID=5886 RepID=A0A8S1QKY0_PARPR|nr:unnamed protein product [Paramecium primaurelia]